MHHQKRKTLDEASLWSSEPETQHDQRLTSTPYDPHRPGYGVQYLKVREKSVGVVCERSNLRITQPHLQNNQKIPRHIQQVYHMSSTLGFNDIIFF